MLTVEGLRFTRKSGDTLDDMQGSARLLLVLASGCSFSTTVRDENPATDASTTSDGSIDAAQTDAPGPTKFALRIDVGNTAGDFTDTAGATWVKDTYCTGDAPTSTPAAVRGTTDDALYITAFYRSNANVTCTITGVPNGMLRVILHGAELWVGGSQSCDFGQQRTMDVQLEGTRVGNDINLWNLSGGCAIDGGGNTGQPFMQAYDIMVSDGTLDVVIAPGNAGQRDPVLQALEIREL